MPPSSYHQATWGHHYIESCRYQLHRPEQRGPWCDTLQDTLLVGRDQEDIQQCWPVSLISRWQTMVSSPPPSLGLLISNIFRESVFMRTRRVNMGRGQGWNESYAHRWHVSCSSGVNHLNISFIFVWSISLVIISVFFRKHINKTYAQICTKKMPFNCMTKNGWENWYIALQLLS